MSYEVTATRRRPQQFENLVGQEFVAETLKNSIKSGKIAHAYLFTGPRGCGKTSSARILAKALNCANGPTDHPCGQCSNCQEITKGASLDVIEIDGASNTSVDNIRRIKDEILFPPTNCRYKIYIIDEVHMLTTSAFNALLKTIEEPPEYVIFIFATTELQKVPATIKSRCQQFNFRLVPIEKVKQCLAEACAEINVTADDEALFWIARESTGSMRDAYTLFDQVVAFSDGHITYDKIRDKLGLVGIDRLNTIFELAVDEKTDEVLNQLDGFLQAGVSIEQLISTCADYLRSLLLIKNGVTKEALLGNSPERYSKKVLSSWNTIQTERALSLYLQLYRDIRYSLSPRYEIELLFSRMCWIKNYVSASEVKKAIDAAQSLLGGAPTGQNLQNQGVGVTPNVTPTAETQTNINLYNNQSSASINSSFQNQQNQNENFQNSGTESFPKGMPTFSALSEVPKETEPYDNSEQFAPDENLSYGEPPHPFHNGGELPPEQSAQNQDFDGGENTSSNPQLNDFLETSDGRKISIAQLRGTVTANLSISNAFAATILQTTSLWKIEGNKIFTTVKTDYDLNTFNQKSKEIDAALSAACGMSVHLEAKVENSEKQTATKTIPPKVQMVIDTFRGSL